MFFALQTVSILVGVGALLATARWLAPDYHRVFVPNSKKDGNQQLWIRALTILGALWAVSLFEGVEAIWDLWMKFPPDAASLWTIGVAMAALIALSYFLKSRHDGEKGLIDHRCLVKEDRLLYFTYLGRVVALVQITGLLLAGAGIGRLAGNSAGLTVQIRMNEFLTLVGYCNGFLLAASLILTTGVLGTELQRRTINAIHGTEVYGREFVMSFGLALTFLLALVYAPVAVATWRTGSALHGEVMAGLVSGPVKNWLEAEKATSDALGVSIGNFLPTSVLSVIAPLIGGVFAGIFGKDAP
jgi:hypothetical protein